MFQINEVVKLENRLYRILTITTHQVIWISLDQKNAFPELINISELEPLFWQEKLQRVDDPFSYIQNSNSVPVSKDANIRDKNFDIIRPLIEDPNFYIKGVRAKHINAILNVSDISKPYLYKLIRRYWQRGQIPNALLPDFKNSGGKGKKRVAKEKKLGRPRQILEGTGALVDDETEKLFRIIIDKYILKKQFSIARAHRKLKGLHGNC